ncbi:uncharacterized protein PHALS_03520 [Plasmopara halstedii]|uniref:Uncharacterized protein n=1 Tax=Plasmopara halstedii TaxID=4781 RepID=A0A0N7L7E4_PLAHL|nr:uncharacterized protein PHALS_03520 [Plasmopara halstedii]CEG46843.1 hypothetical protein PHALS_03520 [Plasmopara halstedii]|eukprot:XP_024583212.1 hypothetical protein PHALS_03520 [Plasmopara halstedii]
MNRLLFSRRISCWNFDNTCKLGISEELWWNVTSGLLLHPPKQEFSKIGDWE